MHMIQSFIQNALVNGEQATLIPIHQLQRVRNEIDRFKRHADLNGFQQWIVNDLYEFDVPNVGFSVQSIILLAIPHPFYAHVELIYHGKTYHCLSLVMSDFDTTENNLKKVLRSEDYHMIATQNIPLKRLAVHSGFAVYGRNNICYIDGMGSNFSFIAYFSDIPCDDEYGTDVIMASLCATCHACVNNCPTGAIQKHRFLVDNEKCLSYLNESGEPFPEWLPKTVHHCVYDCLKCQMTCPMNKEQVKHVVGPIQFTESETQMLLSGVHVEEFSASLKKKAHYLGFHQWPDGIARNIRVLIELSEQEQ
jgi:epoxyqueuosine reductase